MKRVSEELDLQAQMRILAREVVSDVARVDPDRSRELLGAFVSELVLAVADQSRQEERRQKQAEGIARARSQGVRFGRPAKALPDNFEEVHQSWRDGQLTLRQAADACGMPESSFYSAAVRRSGRKAADKAC